MIGTGNLFLTLFLMLVFSGCSNRVQKVEQQENNVIVSWEVYSHFSCFNYKKQYFDTIKTISQNECPVYKPLNITDYKNLLYYLDYKMCKSQLNENDSNIQFVYSHTININDTIININMYKFNQMKDDVIYFHYYNDFGVVMVDIIPYKTYFKKSIKKGQTTQNLEPLLKGLKSNFFPPPPPPPPLH